MSYSDLGCSESKAIFASIENCQLKSLPVLCFNSIILVLTAQLPAPKYGGCLCCQLTKIRRSKEPEEWPEEVLMSRTQATVFTAPPFPGQTGPFLNSLPFTEGEYSHNICPSNVQTIAFENLLSNPKHLCNNLIGPVIIYQNFPSAAFDVWVGLFGLNTVKRGNNHEVQEQSSFFRRKKKIPTPFSV